MSGKVVYKYPIRIDDEWMSVPHGRILLSRLLRSSAGREPGVIEFWVEHNRDALGITQMRVRVVGTGHSYDADWTAATTCPDGPFVWHLVTDWVAT